MVRCNRALPFVEGSALSFWPEGFISISTNVDVDNMKIVSHLFPVALASAALGFMSVYFAMPPAFADPIIGRASVIDGDTISVRNKHIRLSGIDAPESSQTCTDAKGAEYRCGKDAAFALDAFLAASVPVQCEPEGEDRYHRIVATCRRADGQNINAWLVRKGWAVDWERYSHGRYAADQDAAQKAGAGIWQGDFLMPCEYRARKAGRPASC